MRSLPEIDGLSKETVLGAWMAKFDQIFRGDEDPRKRPQRAGAAAASGATSSEMILTKEQLYDMFQNILSVKKYEHQIIYNALQVRCSPSAGLCLLLKLLYIDWVLKRTFRKISVDAFVSFKI